jgi:DNA-binding response OmpR family regulator
LYLLDLDLPDGTGFGLCQKIRELDPTTPIIVTSLHDSERFRKYALNVGAQAFWGKQEDPNRLKLMIENSLRENRVRLLAAKQAEFAAIQADLARQRDEARAQKAQAREIRALCQEKRIMLAAYRAFAEAKGSRAEFDRLWPDICAEAFHPDPSRD